MKRFARIMRLIGGNLLVLLVIVLVADAITRVVYRSKNYTLFDSPDVYVGDRTFIVEHPTRGFSLQPGFKNSSIEIAADGMRVTVNPSASADKTILAIGESTTFGWNVRDGETYPSYLAAALDKDSIAVRVVNAGVPSYTSLQTLIYLEELLPVVKPDVVVINEMWNDIWYSSIRNWFPEMLVWRRPSGWRTFLLKRSAIYRAIVLRADGEGRMVDVFNQDALDFYRKNVEEMIATCRNAGATVVLVHPPFEPTHLEDKEPQPGQQHFSRDFIVDLHGRYTAALEDVAVKTDTPLFETRITTAPDSTLYIDPVHPTALGNQTYASDVARALIRDSILQSR